MEKPINNRRTFLKKLGIAAAVGLVLPRALRGQPVSDKEQKNQTLPLQAQKEPRAVARAGSH